ncbi:hypothetical protein NC651_021176 [Populus alba x Populus x berolinensis]|nr:hypothetical protein NC651_021176 [Populus alba x Populus x berolinensis]
MYHEGHRHLLPCLRCHPHSYIRMVQHLIERCLLLQMSRDQCIKALDKHANIRPIVTLTVWRGLQKENRDFFQAYSHSVHPRPFTSKSKPQDLQATLRNALIPQNYKYGRELRTHAGAYIIEGVEIDKGNIKLKVVVVVVWWWWDLQILHDQEVHG